MNKLLLVLLLTLSLSIVVYQDAFAEAGNSNLVIKMVNPLTYEYTATDPDGIKEIQVVKTNGLVVIEETFNPDCANTFDFFIGRAHIDLGLFTHNHLIIITDCQERSTVDTWKIDQGDSTPIKPRAVGGELIPIETTSLLLAGAQTFSWMIPVVLSVLGIGLFVVSRKSENS